MAPLSVQAALREHLLDGIQPRLAPPQQLTARWQCPADPARRHGGFFERSASAGAEIDEDLRNESFRRKRACTTVSDYSWVNPARPHDSADSHETLTMTAAERFNR